MTKERCAEDFIRESNMIEGIIRDPDPLEISMFLAVMELDEIRLSDLINAVNVFQTCSDLKPAPLRVGMGMDVRVGDHTPPRGGEHIVAELERILFHANGTPHASPFAAHCDYETLHPFMDGNGRSGRLLWAWMMHKMHGWQGLELKFLRAFYYQALGESRE